MAQKYRRTKIKRSKGRLYKKKKSTARKVGETILLIVIIAALGFLGYCIAGPVIGYFQNSGGQSEVTSWEPEPMDITTDSTDTSTEGPTTDETTTAPPDEPASGVAVTLTEADLGSVADYKAALKTAADSGASKVYIPLKDASGVLLYKTEIDLLEDSDADGGTIPAAQLVSLAKSQGLEAAAIFPTLKDCTTPGVWDDSAYRFADDSYTWLDGRAEEGGKRWLDPFRTGTQEYFAAVAQELVRAGFNEILLTDTVYPAFLPYDKEILASHFFADDRYTALSDVVKIFDDVISSVAVDVDLADLLGGFTDSAEVLKDKSVLGDITVNITFTNSDFKNKITLSDEQEVEIGTDITKRIKTLFTEAQKLLPDSTIVPVINTNGLSASDIEKAQTALADMGYTQVVLK